MELTSEELHAYMTVARLECLKSQKIREQIEANPTMLASDLDLSGGNKELTRQDLISYATVAICELRKINNILDEAFGKMEASAS